MFIERRILVVDELARKDPSKLILVFGSSNWPSKVGLKVYIGSKKS